MAVLTTMAWPRCGEAITLNREPDPAGWIGWLVGATPTVCGYIARHYFGTCRAATSSSPRYPFNGTLKG